MNTNLISLIIGICDVLIIFICLKIWKMILDLYERVLQEFPSERWKNILILIEKVQKNIQAVLAQDANQKERKKSWKNKI